MNRFALAVLLFVLVSPLAAAQEAMPVEVLEETDTYRLIRHAGGETQVPLEPERIVTIHTSHLDNAVALGVVPVGVGVLPDSTLTFSHSEYLHDVLAEMTSVGSWNAPNLEAVLALEPDLILIAPRHGEMYGQLARIAPTVIVEPFGIASLWETAKVLGRGEQAEAVLAEYEGAVEDAREALAEVIDNGERAAFLRVIARDNISVYGIPDDRVDGIGYLLHSVLGLGPAPLVPDEFATPISLEVLPELGADHLFLLAQDEEAFESISDLPLWTTIPAVQQGQVYPVSYGMWHGASRVQGMTYFVNYVREQLTATSE